jgi:hypothetical protein
MSFILDFLIIATVIIVVVSNALILIGCILIFVYYRKRDKELSSHHEEWSDECSKTEVLLDKSEMRRFVELDRLSSFLVLLSGYWWIKLPMRPKYTVYVLRAIIVSLIVVVIVGFIFNLLTKSSRFELALHVWNSFGVLATLGFPLAWKNFNVVAPYLYLCPPITNAYILSRRRTTIKMLSIFSLMYSVFIAVVLSFTTPYLTTWYFQVSAFPIYAYFFLFISISVVIVGATAATIHLVLGVLVSDVIFLSFEKKEKTQIAHNIMTALELISRMEKTFPIISHAFSRIMLTIWLYILSMIVNVAICIAFGFPPWEYVILPVASILILLVGLVPCAQVNNSTEKFRELLAMLLRNAMEAEDAPLLLELDVNAIEIGNEKGHHDMFKTRTDRCEALWIDLFRFVEQNELTNAAETAARKSAVVLTEEEREMMWRTSQLSSEKMFRMQVFGVTVSYSLLWRVLSVAIAYTTFTIQYFYFAS